jgi:membrane protease subunit HflK
VLLDTGGTGAGNLVYLPIDKLIEQGRRAAPAESSDSSMTIEGSSSGDTSNPPVERRTRGSR